MPTALILVLVFLSGISALLFETIWLRLSGLVFGNSVWSATLILSGFMGGLALGNTLAAGWKRRGRRPLRVYALLELGVALFGCFIVIALPRVGIWLRPLFQTLWQYQGPLLGLRLVLAFIILLVPTTAMGLTLPVLIDDPLLHRQHFGRAMCLLYGCNTLGAVVGAIAGETYLVRAYGITGTGLIAGFLNCLASALAWLLARAWLVDEGASIDPHAIDSPHFVPFPSEEEIPAAEASKEVSSGRFPDICVNNWRLILVSFGSGMLFLCLEIVWFRFLRLYLASSPTAFALMLAIVLAGIGLGSLAGSLMPRSIVRLRTLASAGLVVTGIAVLVSYMVFPILASQSSEPFFLDRWREIVPLSIALMFPTSFLAGLLFPALVTWVQAVVHHRTKTVGIMTLANTIGATIGPWLASFVLLPTLGFQTTLIACAIGYVLLGVILSRRVTWAIRQPAGMTTWLAIAVLVVILARFPYRRAEEHFARSRSFYEAGGTSHLVRKIEGTSETCQLLRTDLLGEPYFYQLLTNSFSMSSTNPHGQRYMRLFAYLPLTLRPEAIDALLICYGCGVTADALTRDSQLQHIDIVDIAKEILGLAPYYSGQNYSNPLRDSRVTSIVQDGRFFLQASRQQYDVITGEPPPPKVMGSVNLYTEEFFSLMRDRLKDGGIASFWLPIYQLRPDETKAILRAFHNVFPNASVWSGPDTEWIMLGIKGPGRKLTKIEIGRLWSQPAAAADLRRIGLEVPQQLAALFLMDSADIDHLTRDVAPLTDQFPKRLTDAHTDTAQTASLALPYFESAAQRFFTSPAIARIWPETSRKAIEPLFLIRETQYRSGQNETNQMAELEFYLRHTRLRVPVLEVLGSNEFRVAIAREVSESADTIPDDALPELVADALGQRDIGGAVRWLEIERGRGRPGASTLYLLIYLYCLNGDVAKAEALARASSVQKDGTVEWLWKKLNSEFGFNPPG